MNKDRPPETPGLEAIGVSLQYFISEGSPMPPGTPARPRPDRPRYDAKSAEQPAASDEKTDGKPAE
jgi:hypothetical protein